MNLWILVADASHARVFRSNGRRDELLPVLTLTHERSRAKESEINTDRPGGRVRRGPGQHGVYGMAASVRPKEVEAQQFARELAGVLGGAVGRREFDRLALVAPARFLGLLSENLDSQTRKRVLTRLDKDLTHIHPRKLSHHLQDIFEAREHEEHRLAWQR